MPALPKPALRFVRDVTFPDGSGVQPGTVLEKIWVVRNDGPNPWPQGAVLATSGGDFLCTQEVRIPAPELQPGQEHKLSVVLTAPQQPGRYVPYFRMQTAQGQWFGQRLWADLVVTDAEDASQDWNFVPGAHELQDDDDDDDQEGEYDVSNIGKEGAGGMHLKDGIASAAAASDSTERGIKKGVSGVKATKEERENVNFSRFITACDAEFVAAEDATGANTAGATAGATGEADDVEGVDRDPIMQHMVQQMLNVNTPATDADTNNYAAIDAPRQRECGGLASLRDDMLCGLDDDEAALVAALAASICAGEESKEDDKFLPKLDVTSPLTSSNITSPADSYLQQQQGQQQGKQHGESALDGAPLSHPTLEAPVQAPAGGAQAAEIPVPTPATSAHCGAPAGGGPVEQRMPADGVVALSTDESERAQLWARELQLLVDMGFTDVSFLLPILESHIDTPAAARSATAAGADVAADGVDSVALNKIVGILLGNNFYDTATAAGVAGAGAGAGARQSEFYF